MVVLASLPPFAMSSSLWRERERLRSSTTICAAIRNLPLVGSSVPMAHFPRIVFSNSGSGVKLSNDILAGPTVLSAVGVSPPHDGVR
jgi:hypothetical protein